MTKKLNLTSLIFLLGLGFLALNAYNNIATAGVSKTNNCEHLNTIKCAEAKFIELKDSEIWQKINQKKEDIKFLDEDSYGEAKTLQNIATAKLEKQKIKYHQKVLEILENLPPSKQKKLCQDNINFIAKNQIEAKIQAICNQVSSKEMVQGVDNNKEQKGDSFFKITEIPR